MKTIAVLAMTAVAVLASCQQQQAQDQPVQPVVEQAPVTVTK